MDRLIMDRARLIVTVAESEKALISRFYPDAADRVVAIQNGGWSDRFAPLAPLPLAERTHGLYVGSLSLRKNIEGVLKAAIDTARKHGLPFKIVGAHSPILSQVRLEVPEDVRHLVEFCGEIRDTAVLAELYRHAAFLLFPSFYEASPLPPLEAMACGCPVIASDIAPLRERCEDAAVYCDPADPVSIGTAVERVLANKDGYTQLMVERGLAIERHRSWRVQASSLIDAIEFAPA